MTPDKPTNPMDICAYGLTKKELLCGMAMQGILSAIYSSKEMLNEFLLDKTGRKAVTENALSYGTALLKALEEDD